MKITARRAIEAVFLTATLALLASYIYPVLSAGIVAGWDAVPHYYLYLRFLDLLREGRVTGYDDLWYGGLPLFRFYPQLGYFIMALPHLLSFGAISPLFSFQLMIFLLPLIFTVTIFFCAKRLAGPGAGIPALLFTLIFLLQADPISSIGLSTLLGSGLIAGFISFIMLPILFASLESIRTTWSWKLALGIIFITSAIMVTHVMSAMVALFLIVLAITVPPAIPFRRGCWLLLVPIAATFPSWSPMVSEYWLTGGVAQRGGVDPIAAMVTGISLDPLRDAYAQITSALRNPDRPLSEVLLLFVKLLSWRSLLVLICTVTGVIALFRAGKMYLALSFILVLLLFPRNLLNDVFRIAVHAYRFTAYAWVLSLFVSAFGMCEIVRWIRRPERFRATKWMLSSALVALSGLAITNAWLITPPYLPDLKTYPKSADVDALVAYFKAHPPAGRVAAESARSGLGETGSPHTVATLLPICCKISAVPGLLAESAFSAAFLNPTLRVESDHIPWGRDVIANDFAFLDQPLESMMRRFGMYGVSTVVSMSPKYTKALSTLDPKVGELEASFGIFSIFRLKEFRPFLEVTQAKPLLFVDHGGVKFQEFAESWFKSEELLDRRVVYTRTPLAELSQRERAQFGGVLVSSAWQVPLTPEEFAEFDTIGDLTIVVGEWPRVNPRARHRFIPDLNSEDGFDQLKEILLHTGAVTGNPVEPSVRTPERVEFNAKGGVIVNYTYATRWRAADPSQHIFLIAPSMMYVISDGETHLAYR